MNGTKRIFPKLLHHFLLSAFVCSVVVLEGANSQYFNTRCRDNSQCLSSQFLQCLNGYCQCDSRTQIYDHVTNQCSILQGKACVPQQSNSNNNGNIQSYPKCSKNSACVLSKCECQPGYSPDSDYECKPNFHNSCRTPQDCDHTQGLICLGGSCQCRNTTLSYQGIFGCVNPNDPQFIEMMTALKTTERLLRENSIDLDEMINEFDPHPNPLDTIPLNQIQSRQLFSDSGSGSTLVDSVDLTTSAQNTPPGQTAANGFQNLLGVLNTLGSLGQLLGGVQTNRQSAPAASNPPPAQGGNLQNLFSGFTNIMNIFNRIIPRIRNFKMMINPIRIIRRLLMNLRGRKGGYPAAITTAKPVYGPPKPGYGPPPTTASPGGYGGGAPADPGPPAAPAPASAAPAVDEAPQASFNFNTFRSQNVQPTNLQTNSAAPATSSQAQLAQQQANFLATNSYQVQNPSQQQASFNQNQQQQTFPNVNTQGLGNNAYQTINLPLQQSNNNNRIPSTNNNGQFQNQNGQLQQQAFPNNQNFQAQNQNYQTQNQNFQAQGQNFQNLNQNFANQQPLQTFPQNSNTEQTFQLNGFQQQSNTFGNYIPSVNHLPDTTSNNQYPRQERQSTTEEDSPYLPEHL